MQHKQHIIAVVVNYNGLFYNTPCLESLLQNQQACSVVFVDNASRDGSFERIRDMHDTQIQCLSLSKNRLFAYACNRGIEHAILSGADYVLLLNNDTVVESGSLNKLFAFLQATPSAAAVQPLLVMMNDPQRIASAGCRLSRMGGAWDQDCGRSVAVYDDLTSFQVPGITAGAALWRADALRELGLFDESFLMYFEDVDLSLRARKKGYELYTVPAARVRHAVSATTNQAPAGFCVRHCQTNALRLILKHWPQRWLLKDCGVWFVTSSAAFVANLLQRKWSLAKAIGTGMLHGLALLPKGLLNRLRNPMPDNDRLIPWIDRHQTYPPPPESP